MDNKQIIESGNACLGIEFGSTRIKAVLIDAEGNVLASGSHTWENRLENGLWTYSEEDILTGLSDCYRSLSKEVGRGYGIKLRKLSAIGISAMMHGYLAFDETDSLLVPFRTWRNTVTGEAAERLTEEFSYNIPQRWSISHLYQAVLNKEEHVPKIRSLNTLAGYVHFLLTGERVLGIGDASGMFPIDTKTGSYDEAMLRKFSELPEVREMPWNISGLLPKPLKAGEKAGVLTEKGARLLDPSGELAAGCPLCPPEGDAGTGMTATNSVRVRTGNISAGTSVFAMVVLEKELSRVYPEIDLVATPDGALVGMVHCNNCTSEINAWVRLFGEFCSLMGQTPDTDELYTKLYRKALSGAPDCGGLLSYNYLSGEPVTGFAEGALVFARTASADFNLGNFMRMHLYSALAALKVGLDILLKEEGVRVDEMLGHGGFFKTEGVGQSIAAAAVSAPVSVMKTAGEGGAWGAALLAAYAAGAEEGETLPDYLNGKIFNRMETMTLQPDAEAAAGFDAFMKRYLAGLKLERAAVESL